MSNAEKMLEIKDLSVIYKTDLETVYAVNGVTFSWKREPLWAWWARPAPVKPRWP